QIHFNTDESFFISTYKNLFYCRSQKDEPKKIEGCAGYIAAAGSNRFISGNGTDAIYLLEKKEHEMIISTLPEKKFYYLSEDKFLAKEGKVISCYELSEKQFVPTMNFVMKT